MRIIVAGFLLAAAGWMHAAVPNNKAVEVNTTLGSLGVINFSQQFVAGEQARAIVIGDGRSYLGLYIYDSFGNCIEKDDRNPANVRDDLACVWTPSKSDSYGIEVVNLGRIPNTCQLTCK